MPGFKEIKEGLFSYEEAESGWVAEVRSPVDLLQAAAKVREAGVKKFDCFSPFPIHGMDHAMGLKRSWLPFITLIYAILGFILGISYITYIDVFSWPIVYGGKPYWSWPAYVPVLFELTVFFGGTATAAAVIVLGKLGKINRKPLLPRINSDQFAVWIGDDMGEEKVRSILGDLAVSVSKVQEGQS